MNRNELLTLLQLSRGMELVAVRFISAFPTETPPGGPRPRGMTQADADALAGYEDQDLGQSKARGSIYYYKAIGVGRLSPGDQVLVQARSHTAVAEVVLVHRSMPGDLDPNKKLRYIVGRVDLSYVNSLVDEEDQILQQIMAGEVRAKMQQMQQALGFDLSTVATPMLAAAVQPMQPPMQGVTE